MQGESHEKPVKVSKLMQFKVWLRARQNQDPSVIIRTLYSHVKRARWTYARDGRKVVENKQNRMNEAETPSLLRFQWERMLDRSSVRFRCSNYSVWSFNYLRGFRESHKWNFIQID